MFVQHFLLVILWFIFSFFHSIFAAEKWKERMKTIMKSNYKYYRILYSAFAFISLGFIILYHFTINTVMLWKVKPIETIIAVTGMLTGAITMIFFAKKFFFELSGAGIFFKTKRSEILIKTSLYKYVRHPLYTATLLFTWSIFFWQPLLNNLISCICITVYTIIGIRFEEKKLIKNFGESYIQYRSATPMLIPKFY